MKKIVFTILIVLILLFLTVTANAFDGRRKGFILGFGMGPGLTSFTQKTYFGYYIKKDRENKGAIMTDFKIGYAPTDFWEIYYTSKVSWFGRGNVTIGNGLEALGASYYFKPAAPSPFIAAGFGYSTWTQPFESHPPDTWFGFGLFAGGGYEFSRHWSVEGYLSWAQPMIKKSGIETSFNVWSLKCTINVLGY